MPILLLTSISLLVNIRVLTLINTLIAIGNPMKITHVFLLILLCSFSALSLADSGKAPLAPNELLHWQKMIGDWTTTEESLKPDGSGWAPSKGADWNFYWALNGWAIQDDYTSPPITTVVSDEKKRQIGTNIRVFDAEKQQWLMTWVTKTGKVADKYTATSDDKSIVMLSVKPNNRGKMQRITFFNMTGKTFSWKLEFSTPKSNKWLEVYRIFGTRK